jgi:hypothetical protein
MCESTRGGASVSDGAKGSLVRLAARSCEVEVIGARGCRSEGGSGADGGGTRGLPWVLVVGVRVLMWALWVFRVFGWVLICVVGGFWFRVGWVLICGFRVTVCC